MTMLGRKHSPETISKLSGKNNSRYKKIERFCKLCNKSFFMKPFYIKNGRGIYCSKSCLYEARSNVPSWNKGLKGFRANEKSHLWKGGITPLNIGIRTSSEYKAWRVSIFQRDRYTCQQCLVKGTRLHVHHKVEFSKILKTFLSTHSSLCPVKDKLELLSLAVSYIDFWDTNNGITLCRECHHKI